MMFVLMGLGGLTVLLLLIILGLLASLGSTVNAMEESRVQGGHGRSHEGPICSVVH